MEHAAWTAKGGGGGSLSVRTRGQFDGCRRTLVASTCACVIVSDAFAALFACVVWSNGMSIPFQFLLEHIALISNKYM